MTTETLSPTLRRSRLNNRLRSMVTQENIITAVVALIVAGAVIVPLAVLFVSSFRVLDPLGWDTVWGFGNYVEMFTDRIIPKAFLNTLIISSGATILATFLGVSLAWINARTNCPGRDYLEPYNLIPFFLSPFVGAIAWHNLGEPQTGLLNNWVRDLLGIDGAIINVDNIWGVIWVTGIFFAPLVYLFVVGSLRRMDPSLEDSARTTGAGLVRTTMTVTLPLVMPGILSGAIIVFVTSAGEFGVPFKLSAPYGWETLTTQIFSKAVGDDANHYLGAAMSMALGIITVLLIWVQQRYIAPRSFTTVTGKGFRPNVLDLGPWKWVAFSYNLMFIAVAVVLPIICLLIVSLHPVWTGSIVWTDITFINYVKTLFWWRPDAISAPAAPAVPRMAGAGAQDEAPARPTASQGDAARTAPARPADETAPDAAAVTPAATAESVPQPANVDPAAAGSRSDAADPAVSGGSDAVAPSMPQPSLDLSLPPDLSDLRSLERD